MAGPGPIPPGPAMGVVSVLHDHSLTGSRIGAARRGVDLVGEAHRAAPHRSGALRHAVPLCIPYPSPTFRQARPTGNANCQRDLEAPLAVRIPRYGKLGVDARPR